VVDLHIRPEVVFSWLKELKAVNPYYNDIIIDESNEMRNQLKQVTERLIINAEILSSDMEITIDKFATEKPVNETVEDKENH